MFNNVRMKQLRKEKRLTQLQLSEMLGYKNNSVANIEKGSINPSFDKIVKLAEIFNVEITELIRKEK